MSFKPIEKHQNWVCTMQRAVEFLVAVVRDGRVYEAYRQECDETQKRERDDVL